MDTGAKTNVTQLVIFFAGLMLGGGGGYLYGAVQSGKECNAEISKANRQIEKANKEVTRQRGMLSRCPGYVPGAKAAPKTVNPFGR